MLTDCRGKRIEKGRGEVAWISPPPSLFCVPKQTKLFCVWFMASLRMRMVNGGGERADR